jgi:hypothetical protein
MTISPAPKFPERAPQVYEMKAAGNATRRGPLRFEEGIATDTDVPTDFQKGMQQGMVSAAGRPNHNANVFEKPAAETLSERAHVGSAAWVEAPTFLGEFAHGTYGDNSAAKIETKVVSGGRSQRQSATVVND